MPAWSKAPPAQPTRRLSQLPRKKGRKLTRHGPRASRPQRRVQRQLSSPSLLFSVRASGPLASDSPIHRHRRASTMKDPFEAAVEEQDSPPESPAPPEEEAGAAGPADDPDDYDGCGPRAPPPRQPPAPASLAAAAAKAKGRVQREQQEDEDDEEDQMEVDLEKLPSSTGDPDKLAKMKSVPHYALPVQRSYLVNYIALIAVEIRWVFVFSVISSIG